MGKCVSCSEKIDGEHTQCLACRMGRREKEDTRSKESKERHAKWLKRRRDLLYAFGVCVMCGKKDAKPGTSTCPWCKAKAKVRSEKYRRTNPEIIPRMLMNGDELCARCGCPKTNNGHKVCDGCYPALKAAMLHARSEKAEINYFEEANVLFFIREHDRPYIDFMK